MFRLAMLCGTYLTAGGKGSGGSDRVKWLNGQGESKAPHSWKTLLQALHQAGHIDMANHVEKCIGDGTLELS